MVGSPWTCPGKFYGNARGSKFQVVFLSGYGQWHDLFYDAIQALWGLIGAGCRLYVGADRQAYSMKVLRERYWSRNALRSMGIRAFDVRNRTRKGNHERVLIIATPLELMIFKVSGTLEYLKDNDYLNNVFSSFRITSSNSRTTTVAGPHFGFEAKMPGAALQDNSEEVLLTGYNLREYQSYDEYGNYYRLKRSSFHDRMYIEEDTFELNYIASKFQEKLQWEETHREYAAEPYPTLYTTCVDSGEYIFSKYLIRGPHLLSNDQARQGLPNACGFLFFLTLCANLIISSLQSELRILLCTTVLLVR